MVNSKRMRTQLNPVDYFADQLSPATVARLYAMLPDWGIAQIRAHRFRQVVRYVGRYSPFYRQAFRKHGIDPRMVRTPMDLGKFYTTPDDIVADPKTFLCRDPSIVFESSGTSGKNKQIYYDRRELAQIAQIDAAGLRLMGLEPTDRVANAFDFSMWIPGMLAHNALLAAGTFCMAFGKVDPLEVYRRLRQYRFNVILGEPTWLIRLTELAEADGGLPLKLLIGGAEEMPRDAVTWMNRVWQGAHVRMCYGSVELGSALGYQPCEQFDGYHVDDTDFYPEILDPGEDGYGELVFTTLRRTVMPLLRYRTRDVTRLLTERCPCGHVGMRMSRLRGRRDELIVASGGNLYPLMFENILRPVAGLTHDWQVIFKLQSVREIMEVHVESARTDKDLLRRDIQQEMRVQYPDLMKNLGIGIFEMRIIIHAPGSLRRGRKLKRMVDLRQYDAAVPPPDVMAALAPPEAAHA
ncbi:MAG: phenylacetate--CoA ligase family protein [Phycisphaerae bacterium]